VREIEQHLAALHDEYAIDPDRIVVAGFSMGGGLATWLALSQVVPARGWVGVNAFLPDVESVLPLIELSHGQGLRAYLVASQRDATCYAIAQRLARMLPPRDIPCELELHPDLGHNFPPEFEHSLIKGLDFIMRQS
jgi:predicted esterase